MYKRINILILLALFILTSGFGCKTTNKKTKQAMEPIKLTYWRVFDGADDFAEIINNYRLIHPNITIEYKKLRYEEYESELLNALAEDRGPDILSLHNTWIPKYKSKLSPMPESITMAYPEEKGSLKKETVTTLKTSKTPSLVNLKNSFIDVVYNDIVIDSEVYGLAFSVDTLALYYNRDLLNNAGIINPPHYWNKEFQQNVKKLTLQDPVQGIVQSGIALGGSTNIERYSDILSVLMMQNGATMLDGKRVLFNTIPPIAQSMNYNPGLEALRFYIDFSNPSKEVYSWNSELNNSLQMFIDGKLALMLGYSYHEDSIKAAAPKLNFSISSLPQIEGSLAEINFANYWIESVSKKSKHAAEAWDFLLFASRAEQIKSYLDKTKKPTALRSLISSQLEDDALNIFASQLLTAKSWYKGNNIEASESAIAEMIDRAQEDDIKLIEVLNTGASKVQQTIY